MCQDVQRAQPCRLAALVDADPGAELADVAALAVPLTDLPSDKDEVAGDSVRHVIGHWRGRFRQLDPELRQPRLDFSAHRRCLPLSYDRAPMLWSWLGSPDRARQ